MPVSVRIKKEQEPFTVLYTFSIPSLKVSPELINIATSSVWLIMEEDNSAKCLRSFRNRTAISSAFTTRPTTTTENFPKWEITVMG